MEIIQSGIIIQEEILSISRNLVTKVTVACKIIFFHQNVSHRIEEHIFCYCQTLYLNEAMVEKQELQKFICDYTFLELRLTN